MNTVEKKIYKHVENSLKAYKIPYDKVKTYTDSFIAHTKYGDWRITPDHTSRSKLVTIFTRFDDVDNIDKNEFRGFYYSSFSGKLNFLYFDENIKTMFSEFDNLCSIVA